MRSWLYIQYIVIPLSVLLGVLSYPELRHFAVDLTSPVFPTQQAASHWLDTTARLRHCLPAATRRQVFAEYAGITSPWFGTLHCSRYPLSVQWATLFAVPYGAINLVLLPFLIPRKRRPR